MNTVLASGPEQVVTLRRLKWLGAVLVLSNLFLGALSVYLLRTQDANYTRLLNDSVPVMNEVRRLSRAEGYAFRHVIEARVAIDATARAGACVQARASLQEAEGLRKAISQAPMLAARPDTLRALSDAVTRFQTASEQIMTSADDRPGRGPEDAAPVRLLAGAGDQVAAAVQQVADRLEADTNQISDSFTADMRSRSAFLLSIAGWPLLLAGAVVALTVAVVVVMLFVFRQADAGGEGP